MRTLSRAQENATPELLCRASTRGYSPAQELCGTSTGRYGPARNNSSQARQVDNGFLIWGFVFTCFFATKK